LPESIKNNYTAIVRNRLFKDETINFYERDDKNNTVIAFEDRKDSINTSRSDEKTIKAMLDIAVSKNWASVSLKGTEEFKQKAWLEASIRGIETKGYVPTEKDLAELKIAQQERTSNAIQYEASVKPEIKVDEKNLGEDKPKENELNKDIQKEKPSLSLDQLKTVQDVRNYIGKVIATGLENGTINNRDTLIDSLKKEGLTVVREVNKSISIENPIG
ncbi:LPD7 domain-containing protein, partial [Acinetobacter towneri]|uniref:LPD7 domain-containing protein n=1 Tax=Acinetobacter towneri TaxID=202956 RepID=UPI0034D406CB